MEVPLGLLRIVRDSGYADRLRAYTVTIDGNNAGEIKNGETKDFPITPGQHVLALKIDWCGSNTVEFHATDEDVITFDARSNLRGSKLVASIWHALFAWNSWIVLNRRLPDGTPVLS
jgi:hypothetical protein